MLQWFLVLYFLGSLAAYNAGPIPLPWVAQFGVIALAVGVILFTNRIRVFPGAIFLILFVLWTFFVNTSHLEEFSGMMPAMSTLPYWAYITARFITLLSFVAAAYLTYWLVAEGEGAALVRGLVFIGFVVALIAIYIYFAHIFHLPEPPRNRMGTGGAGKQATLFSGMGGLSYQRALGTFREPGHLAEWLLIPMFLSFAFRDRLGKMRSAAYIAAFSLTLSMTGLFSAVAGILGALVLTRPFSMRTLKIVGFSVVVGAIAFFILSKIAIGIVGESRISIGTLVSDRVMMTLFGGIAKSNRSYVYDFLSDNPISMWGIGLGNGNLLFAKAIGVDTPASFLNMYVFTLYSAGYLGMALLGAFILRPMVVFARNFKRTISVIPLVLMAYIGYLVSLTVGSEELTAWFGISAGLLACEAQRLRSIRAIFARKREPADIGKLAAIP